jgi:outer membrane protein OmpU
VLVDEGGGTPDELRAVSRVRFGFNMTGETDSGITFGAEILADDAEGGDGGDEGQTEGSVFVTGSWGTLSFGDTDGADELRVGHVPGNFSLTDLGDLGETRFVSNGGDFGADNGASFADNPVARPTVRYDFDLMGFGISVSSNRDLTDVTLGTGYSADFGGGSWTAGIGYNKFDSFIDTSEGGLVLVDTDGDGIDDAVVEGAKVETEFPEGEQWTVGLGAEYESFALGITYMKLDADTADIGEFDADNLLVGGSFGWNAWSFGAVYGKILDAEGELEDLDGDDSYLLSAQYDLGGGATVNGGLRRTYGLAAAEGGDGDEAWIGDFGISIAF